MIVNGYFTVLVQTDTAAMPTVLGFDIPCHAEASFISSKCKFLIKNTVRYYLPIPVKKPHSLIAVFFSYSNLCCFIWLW
jgi:hypothetical protein